MSVQQYGNQKPTVVMIAETTHPIYTQTTSFRTTSILLIISMVLSFALPLLSFPQKVHAAATVVFLTSGTSWTVPSDFSSINVIEVIGGGGGGAGGKQAVSGAAAGGGGAYSKIGNLSLSPGASVSYPVGVARAPGPRAAGRPSRASLCPHLYRRPAD